MRYFSLRTRKGERLLYLSLLLIFVTSSFLLGFRQEYSTTPSENIENNSIDYSIYSEGNLSSVQSVLSDIQRNLEELENSFISNFTAYYGLAVDAKLFHQNSSTQVKLVGVNDASLLRLGVNNSGSVYVNLSNSNLSRTSSLLLEDGVINRTFYFSKFVNSSYGINFIQGIETTSDLVLIPISNFMSTITKLQKTSKFELILTIDLSETMINELAFSVRGQLAWNKYIKTNTELDVQIKSYNLPNLRARYGQVTLLFGFQFIVVTLLLILTVQVLDSAKETLVSQNQVDRLLKLNHIL